jgi:iron-sulfur cluster repair protein YtfE (RIC family)
MVEREVEDILSEIRERVRAEAPPSPAHRRVRDASSGVVSLDAAAVSFERADAGAGDEAQEALARLEANLATAERAWNKLPPLMSYRTGALARLELWLKRQIKRATHWFTWEQVNFNAASYHALRDALAALRAYERQLSRLEAALDAARADAEAQRAAAETHRAQWEAARAEFEAQTRAALDAHAARLQEQHAHFESLHTEQRALLDGRASALQNEMRERVDHLLEEQRVCFRQLSLEASETAVRHDRARRDTEARLADLEKAVTGDG